MLLADRASREVRKNATVVVPLGSTEQHGPHLPLATDSVIAEAVATRLADRAGLLVAPTVAYGASGEHQDFPGTISVGQAALELMLVELGRSLCTWAGRVLIVNGHGGNASALVRVVKRLRDEGRDVAWSACEGEAFDLHAGHSETSLMLHVVPYAVDMSRAEVGDCGELSDLLPQMRAGGIAAVSHNGVLGDPTEASAAAGRRILDAIVADLAERLSAWQVSGQGTLLPEVSV